MKQLKRAHWWGYLQENWRRVLAFGVVGALVIMLGVQLGYPWNKLPLYASVSGVSVGGDDASQTARKLDKLYAAQAVDIYFGESPKPYVQPKPDELGLKITSKQQVENAKYTWWLRLVPTSLWWAHSVAQPGQPTYSSNKTKVAQYVSSKLGDSCNIKAENASVKYDNGRLTVVPVVNGGTCRVDDVVKLLEQAKPTLAKSSVRVPMVAHPAKVQNTDAKEYIKIMNERTQKIEMQTVSGTLVLPQSSVLSWLKFTSDDDGIVTQVDAGKAAEYLTTQVLPRVSIKPGTSYISTRDFQIISRVTGPSGRTLDRDSTVDTLNRYLNGENVQVEAKTMSIEPDIAYTRQYTKSDEGLQALLQQFAETHKGTFGVKYIELSGDHRNAGYNENRIFETASTYKLFVAYSTLLRIDDGRFSLNDQIAGGRNLATCFDDMIVKSDNDCAEALLYKIGQAQVTNEIQALGLKNTSFMKSYIQSTAADEALFLGMLENNQLKIKPDSRARLLGAMKRNIYRNGVPAGASGQVADKVGFLYALLHDASIVYSPGGVYVLVVLTDGSSWSAIADLTREIEKFRAL